jgi:hypothetical protein
VVGVAVGDNQAPSPHRANSRFDWDCLSLNVVYFVRLLQRRKQAYVLDTQAPMRRGLPSKDTEDAIDLIH